MSSSIRHRLLNQIARNAAWSSSAWLVVMVGCVDAPKESFSPVEAAAAPTPTAAAAGELVQADLTESVAAVTTDPLTSQVVVTEPSPFNQELATGEPQPTLAPDQAGPGPGLFPIPEPEPGTEPTTVSESEGEPLASIPGDAESGPKPTLSAELAPDAPEAQPTVADDGAEDSASTVPAPFPGTDQPAASLEPEPEEAEPTPTDVTVIAKSKDFRSAEPTLPTVLPPAGQSAVNANVNPLEAVKPRGYIHINPKPKTPENASVPGGNVNQNIIGKTSPAAVQPPSSGTDAAALAPLPEQDSTDSAPAAEPSASLTSTEVPVSPVSTSSTESDTSPATEIPEGFTPQFSGQDMTGWEVIDGKVDSWEFKDGVVSCVAPGGGWIQTLAMYSDFELRFEYRLSPGGNSGVSLRYPGHGNPSLEGLEIQLIDDQAEKYKNIQPEQATGSLYFAAAPQVRDAAQPAGTWNHCAVRCVGQRLEVSINDKLVNEIDLTQINTRVEGVPYAVSSIRSPMGAIALQSHVTRVDFRQVALRDLTQALTSGVRTLDLHEGAGEAAPAGSKVTVHYIGHLSTGKRFANSIEKDKPVTVDLRDVIPGWREGIPGMKVGGKRRLVVPPAMAYGEKGFKEVVPPNSTLVYEIELLAFELAEDEAPLEAAAASAPDTTVK